MIFSQKKELPNYPMLKMNEHSLNRVDTHTHLGVTLNSKITWHDHVKRVTEKAYRVINMIKRIRHLVPRSTLENLYKTLVRPILEYGNMIYANLSHQSQPLYQTILFKSSDAGNEHY